MSSATLFLGIVACRTAASLCQEIHLNGFASLILLWRHTTVGFAHRPLGFSIDSSTKDVLVQRALLTHRAHSHPAPQRSWGDWCGSVVQRILGVFDELLLLIHDDWAEKWGSSSTLIIYGIHDLQPMVTPTYKSGATNKECKKLRSIPPKII
jgi:hypothetical protein